MTDAHAMHQALLADVEAAGTAGSRHLVAFSGGVDSSVVAHAVREVFPDSSMACLGVSASLSAEQHALARRIASHIGIPLREIQTHESDVPAYVENTGLSCYHCKATLYATMEALMADALGDGGLFVLYNGTNADDTTDPTRVGLRAAAEHAVRSPLARFSKEHVRAIARHAGLPHWNIAASPCLRSRLQIGVPATDANLARVEAAERRVRDRLALDSRVNLRVRAMTDGSAMIEVDEAIIDLVDLDACTRDLRVMGFTGAALRAFRSGSVSRPSS